MYIANATDDYDHNNFSNCTDNKHNIEIFIPTLLFTFPCGLSFLCFMNLIVYTLIKPLINKKEILTIIVVCI